jgi:hypothetical protein
MDMITNSYEIAFGGLGYKSEDLKLQDRHTKMWVNSLKSILQNVKKDKNRKTNPIDINLYSVALELVILSIFINTPWLSGKMIIHNAPSSVGIKSM